MAERCGVLGIGVFVDMTTFRPTMQVTECVSDRDHDGEHQFEERVRITDEVHEWEKGTR